MLTRRKHHTKSRKGCNTCKKRRIKCDEKKPACLNCNRRGRDCIYSQGQQLDHQESNGHAAASDNGISANVLEQSPRSLLPTGSPRAQHPSLTRANRVTELYLMHHFSTVTVDTLTNLESPEEVRLWRVLTPKEAVKYEFLADGLLALASLHLAYLEPSMSASHIDMAMRYQNAGLYGFHEALDHINGENFHALFGFSVLIVLLALAMQGVSNDRPVMTPTENLISIFKLLQGVQILTKTGGDNLVNGMFGILLQPRGGPRAGKGLFCRDQVQDALCRLLERIDSVAKYVGPSNHQAYVSSVEALDSSFHQVATTQNLGTVLAWPAMADEQLLALLQQGDPTALLICIHYGVLLLHVQNQWWAKDFGINLIRNLSEIVQSVDSEWGVYTQWARDCADATERN